MYGGILPGIANIDISKQENLNKYKEIGAL